MKKPEPKRLQDLRSIGLMSDEDIKETKSELGAAIRVHQFPKLSPLPQAYGWMAIAALEAIIIAGLETYIWYKYLRG